MAKADLTAHRLRELLTYDHETGVFTNLTARGGICVGRKTGRVDSRGYLQICLDGRRHLAHRLAWLYVTGQWPANEIDHINNVRLDNRLSNLREADRSINMQNIRNPRLGNTSGCLGVSYHKITAKWVAQIQAKGKKKHLGVFNTIEEAANVYIEAKRRLHEGCTI